MVKEIGITEIPYRVLLVEDNPGDARLIDEYLLAETEQGRQYELITANRLSAGIDQLARGRIDVILLDLGLPDSSGYDTFADVQERAPETPVVILSGLGDTDLAKRTVESGAQDYLLKENVNQAVLVRALTYAVERQRLRRRLQENEERLRTIVNSVSDGILLVDGRGIIHFANPAAADLFDRAAEKLAGKPLGLPLPDKGSIEVEIEATSGKVRHAIMQARETAWQGRKLYTVSLHDVTENKALERRLQQINRARMLMSESNRALARAKDEEHLLAAVCRLAVEIGGYRLAWVGLANDDAGKTVTPVAQFGLEGYVEQLDLTWADTEHGRGPTGTAIRTRQPAIAQDIPRDPAFRPWREAALKHGFASSIALPLVSQDRCFGAFCLYAEEADAFSAEEVTLLSELGKELAFGMTTLRAQAEKQQAEEALQQREEHFRALIEKSLDIIAVLDGKGALLYGSPSIQQMLGYDPGSLIGKGIFSLVHPEDVQELRRGLEALAATPGRTLAVEFRLCHADGSWRIIEASSKNLLDDPVVAGIVINARDLTEERRRQEYLQAQERLMTVGQLAAGIAHDFNNIMATIALLSGTLERDPDHPTRQSYSRTISEQARHAGNLIGQILDFSRRSIMTRRQLDLLPFVKEVARLLRRTLPESIEVDVTAAQRPYLVTADPTHLQQVLMNLAVNARDAMPDGGVLQIGLAALHLGPRDRPPLPEMAPGQWIMLGVSDSGHGIPAEAMPHLFEPFFTTKEPGRGTGLGLAQVYGIVKQLHGEIEVISKVGQGSTFLIYLPASVAPSEKEAGRNDTAPTAGRGELILVAEDNRATREAICDVLTGLGYSVVDAANGEEALHLFTEHAGEIALIVSDLVMPIMGGTELHARLREVDPSVKMVLMTGYPLEDGDKELLYEGVVAWVQKPFNISKLATLVDDALGKMHP